MRLLHTFGYCLAIAAIVTGCGRVADSNTPSPISSEIPDVGYWRATNVEPGNDFRALVQKTNGSVLCVSSKRGAYRSVDHGETWISSSAGLKSLSAYALALTRQGEILVGTNGRGVFRSDDDGVTWVNLGLDGISVRSLLMVNGLVVAGSAGQGVFLTSDGGDRWEQTEGALIGRSIFSLALSDDVVLAGTDRGVYASRDKGLSWRESGATYAAIRHLCTDGRSIIYAATTSGFLMSINNGETWFQRNTGLTSLNAWAVTLNADGEIFFGTKEGVFRSSDRGLLWQTIGSELPNQYVRSLYINPDGFLFVGTNGGGIYRSEQSTVQ